MDIGKYKRLSSLLMLLCGLGITPVVAGEFIVSDGYVRATPPGVPSTAGYLTLENNTEEPWVLVAITSDRAKQVMVHQIQQDDDMMRMRHISALEIAPGQRFHFKPGGHHLMLSGLAQPLRPGERISLILAFRRGQTLAVDLPVQAIGATMETKGQHE